MGVDGTVLEAVRTAHNVNKVICEFLGDTSQVDWYDAPQAIKDSAMAGVQEVLDNPEITSEGLHNKWMGFKKSQGYVYGEVKDDAQKTHPCMIPYSDLPKEQQLKDKVFRTVVLSLVGDKM
jgi:hypothetical protein